eukprot:SAG31_NODE_2910_length_4916_cov_3.526545_3_plen_140_part_00
MIDRVLSEAAKCQCSDMKLENILLTADKQHCKVCDFGLAKNVLHVNGQTVVGTGQYVAPQVLEGASSGGYDACKADMWSCGVCLYAMVNCRFPFSKADLGGVGAPGQKSPTESNLELLECLMTSTCAPRSQCEKGYHSL